MSDQPEPARNPPLRASDRDREQVAALLQHAMSEGRITVAELETRLDSVYAAKTLVELEPVTRDLPGHSLSLLKPSSVAVPQDSPVMSYSPGGPATGNVVGVMSGGIRKGQWTAPAHLNAVAIMGGVELDFTHAQLTGRETVIMAVAIMGGVEITVPEGITVHVEGIGIMGGFNDGVRQNYGPDAPVLRIKGVAIMGGVDVQTSRKQLDR